MSDTAQTPNARPSNAEPPKPTSTGRPSAERPPAKRPPAKRPKGGFALTVGIILLLVLVTGAGLLLLFGGDLFRRTLEEATREATGTRVTIAEARADTLPGGTITLEDVRIWNPDGFSDAPALRFAQVVLTRDPEANIDAALDLDSVHFRTPQVLAEQRADGRLNLEQLRRTLEDRTMGNGDGSRQAIVSVRTVTMDTGSLTWVAGDGTARTEPLAGGQWSGIGAPTARVTGPEAIAHGLSKVVHAALEQLAPDARN